MNRKIRCSAMCMAAVLTICPRALFAMFIQLPQVPVERLLKNVAAHVKENPKDAQGYYLLGRINALAFHLKARALRAQEKPRGGDGKLPRLDPWQGRPKTDAKALTHEQLNKHLADSVRNYRKAIALAPGRGLYHLGLAWVLDTGAARAAEGGVPPVKKTSATQPAREGPKKGQGAATTRPATEDRKKIEALVGRLGHKEYKVREAAQEALRKLIPGAVGVLVGHANHKDAEVKVRVRSLLADYWRERAVGHYLRAHELAVDADLKIKNRPARGLNSLVSYEAGRAWIRIVKQRGVKESETQTLARVQKNIQALDAKKPGWITPIIFSLTPHARLGDLLAEGRTVAFDLDGTGRAQRWPWVKATTGILVWDPDGRGQITSGRQLFGSVTWWMFWRDGYHALSALDDNRDGQLTGAELQGLAVWFDRNGNGVSDAGEVVRPSALGIVSLSARATGKTGLSPTASAGLKLRSGKVLPTYDWVVAPAPTNEGKTP